MDKITKTITGIIKTVTELGIGLIAFGVVAEIIFGQDAIFGHGVVSNLSAIVTSIGGSNGFVGLIAILLIVGLIKNK